MLWIPALALLLLIVLPLGFILVQVGQTEPAQWLEWLKRPRTLELIRNTLLLTVGVGVATSLLAIPLAWVTSHTDLPGHRAWTLAGVLPLAIPGYLMAYTLLGLGGLNGVIAKLTPWDAVPRPSGYWGALLALSLSNFPYLFLPLRTGLLGLDPALEETARSLGSPPAQVLRQILLPQLLPAYASGLLLVLLHVIGDFGVVSLMRYETLSYSLYSSLFTRNYAAFIALLLVLLATLPMIAEARLILVERLDRTGSGAGRTRQAISLGSWRWPLMVGLLVLVIVSLGIPLMSLAYWCLKSDWAALISDLASALGNSLRGSLPAAIFTTLMALLFGWLARRHPGSASLWLQRGAFLGYATPPLAFGLGWVVLALSWPTLKIYQTLPLLVMAYSCHFLAEALGPVRTSLQLASPRLEEASYALGYSRLATAWRVTLPILRGGLGASAALVFLACMKELPLTMVLAPLGHHTLAYNVYDRTTEADFAGGAPYALAILLFAAAFVSLVLQQRRSVSTESTAR